MYTTYILQSETTGGYYCGHTEDLERRLRQHNDPDYPFTRTTKRIPGPWRVVWQSASSTRSDAMALERRIKKQGVGRFLDRLPSAESRLRRDEPAGCRFKSYLRSQNSIR